MRLQPLLIGAVFLAAGVTHFRAPGMYERIVPPGFPAPAALVAISGAAELLGAAGVQLPATRKAAGIGLVALLVAVFPANVYMALASEKFAPIPAWVLWARLPLQPLAIWWVWRACVAAP